MYRIPKGYSLFQEDLQHIDAGLAQDWPALHGAHLLVTGGTGFFGRWLVESLLWANDAHGLELHVTVLSRNPGKFLAATPHLGNRQGLSFLRGSLTDFDTGQGAMGPYTHILHAASETNPDHAPDWAERHLAGAIDGTRRVLELAAIHRSHSVLLVSSGAVYLTAEPLAGNRYREGPAGLPDMVSEKSVYGQAKRMMEVMAAVSAQAHGFRAPIARCFAFVGPYLPLDSNYAIGNFIRDALAGRDIVVQGDGTPLRSYLYAADLVVWLLAILLRGQSGCPYNVGGKEALSIGDVARAVRDGAGGHPSVVIRQAPVAGATPHAYLPDISRAENTLGLKVRIDMDEAIKRTLEWHRLHGQ